MSDALGRPDLFEIETTLPDAYLESRATGLIGFDVRFDRLGRTMELLLNPKALAVWASRFHGADVALLDAMSDRYPLAVLHGDVGTGKTAFAEGAANALCRIHHLEGTLFKLSNRVRGVGQVGQMSHLIAEAFTVVEAAAGRKRVSVLLIDEADSLAASRGQQHSHHEDKVAVNTLIQKIDDARRIGGRILVILCTNRFAVLDPALIRRAALIEEFHRPGADERHALLSADLSGLGISPHAIDEAVGLTGADMNAGVGFTFSDLRTRLLPTAVLRAYPDRPLTDADIIESATAMMPSPALVVTETVNS
jgi:AAA+ superfamily predicted ATPase